MTDNKEVLVAVARARPALAHPRPAGARLRLVVAVRRACPAHLFLRPGASVRRRAAPWYRRRRQHRLRRLGPRGRRRLVLRHDARQRADPEHPDRRRLHGLAHASRIARRSSGCRRGRGGRRGQDRSERDARARHAVRPPGHSPNSRRERLRRSVVPASGESAACPAAATGDRRHDAPIAAGHCAACVRAAGARRTTAGGALCRDPA